MDNNNSQRIWSLTAAVFFILFFVQGLHTEFSVNFEMISFVKNCMGNTKLKTETVIIKKNALLYLEQQKFNLAYKDKVFSTYIKF